MSENKSDRWNYGLARATIVYLFCVVSLLAGCKEEDFKEMSEYVEKNDVSIEWAQWRGPNRDGKSNETQPLKKWSEDGPPVLWRKEIGDGFSAISVKGDRAYILYTVNDDEMLYCLDVKTGMEIWSFRLNETYIQNWGNGPRSTPIIEDDVVYTMGSYGKLYALNATTGEQIWQVDIHGEPAEAGVDHDKGHSSSPLIDGDLLIVGGGQQPNKSVIALNKSTGEVVWTYERAKGSYCSPTAWDIIGKRQIVSGVSTGYVGLDAQTGEALWDFHWETEWGLYITTKYIFISLGYRMGTAMLAIERNGDSWKAGKVWANETFRNNFNSPVSHEGHIYGFDNKILKCINARSGQEMWKARGFGNGSLILSGNVLIVLGVRGNLGLVEATPTAYKNLANAQVIRGKCWTMPTLANGKLFLRSDRQMVCLDLMDKS